MGINVRAPRPRDQSRGTTEGFANERGVSTRCRRGTVELPPEGGRRRSNEIFKPSNLRKKEADIKKQRRHGRGDQETEIQIQADTRSRTDGQTAAVHLARQDPEREDRRTERQIQRASIPPRSPSISIRSADTAPIIFLFYSSSFSSSSHLLLLLVQHPFPPAYLGHVALALLDLPGPLSLRAGSSRELALRRDSSPDLVRRRDKRPTSSAQDRLEPHPLTAIMSYSWIGAPAEFNGTDENNGGDSGQSPFWDRCAKHG